MSRLRRARRYVADCVLWLKDRRDVIAEAELVKIGHVA